MNDQEKFDRKVTWVVIISGILALVYFTNDPVFNKKTSWMDATCDYLIADSLGTELVAMGQFIIIHKPSILNDLMHSEIRWRERNLGNQPSCEPITFKFYNRENGKTSTIETLMFSNGGSNAGYQICSDEDYRKISSLKSNIISSDIVSVRKVVSTSSGYAEDRLGIWKKNEDERVGLINRYKACS